MLSHEYVSKSENQNTIINQKELWNYFFFALPINCNVVHRFTITCLNATIRLVKNYIVSKTTIIVINLGERNLLS